MKDSSKAIPDGDKFRSRAINAIVALFLIASIPGAFAGSGNEFDERWMYLLNFVRKDEYIFGKNIFFTYGPLGFLTCVRAVKDSLFVGLAWWLAIYAAFVYLMMQVRRILLDRKVRVLCPAVALFLFLLPQKMVGDVLVSFYVWLAVALLVACDKEDRRGILYAVIADILLALLFLWKMSSFTSSFAVCFVSAFILLFIRKEWKKALLLSLSLPAVICAYLIYNPSVSDFLCYCRAAVEISGGYNAVMGNVMTPDSFSAFFVVFGVAAGLILALCLWNTDKKSFAIFVPLFVPLFFYYKYGIVRQGGFAFYQGVCMSFSIFFLFGLFDFLFSPSVQPKLHGWGKLSLVYVLALCVLEFPSFLSSIPQVLKDSTLGLPSQIIDRYLISVRNGAGKTLNPAFKEIVNGGSVAIFPDELFYLADGSTKFRAMPIIQNYTAYTAWLDEKNAAFFTDGGTGAAGTLAGATSATAGTAGGATGATAGAVAGAPPDFVLFGLEGIDMRLPLAETPATYSAIRENYELVAGTDTELLFKRKDGAPGRKHEKREIVRGPWSGNAIDRPSNARYMSIDMKLSLLGKLAEFFWKSLPVFIDIEFDDGSVNGGRIVPRTATNPIAVDELVVPYSGVHPREDGATVELAKVISQGPGKRAVSVDFRMKGLLRLYYKDITVCWWTD
ncbi:MAG: hypothetical protein K6G18_14270 [Treponema sp.]|nr:hypothetical protein [Treponema sp.]